MSGWEKAGLAKVLDPAVQLEAVKCCLNRNAEEEECAPSHYTHSLHGRNTKCSNAHCDQYEE